MTLFFRFFRPRSWRSLSVWVPLLAVGFISCVGLSLAIAIPLGVLAQYETAKSRDGGSSFSPRTRMAGEPPLRSSRTASTGYGPLVITVFWGEEGQRLNLPGIPSIKASGTVLASPAVIARLDDDWTGEIGGWLGDRPARALPLDADALAHPRELVVVEFTDTVRPEIALRSNFQPIRYDKGYAPYTDFVILGFLVLALPSIALARAGAAVHLNARSRRYGLLRVLGAAPRQLAAVMVADMSIPMLAGGLVGSVAYAVVISLLDSFTVAGNSYWASDLFLPFVLALTLPVVVVIVGLMSVLRMIVRAGRDPVGTLRRGRKPPSYLSYFSAAALVAGLAAVYAAAYAERTLSALLIVGGLLLSVIGLEGLSRIAVAISGKLLMDRTRAHVAGSRMLRSGAEALLGVFATSVAVLLVMFSVYANFDNIPPPIGNFDVLIRLPTLRSHESVVRAVEGIRGVERVVPVGRIPVRIDGHETSVYTMTCEDAHNSVRLDAPCAAGTVFLARSGDADTVTVAAYASPYPGGGFTDEDVLGTYPVAGQVTASWITGERDEAVMIVDEQPIPNHTLLLVTTDGKPGSLRGVIDGLRVRPEESYPITKAALETGATDDTLVTFPYLFVMATTAAVMAAVAMLYAVILLFRQRQTEFRMLRALGATRMLLAVDLALLFAVPLILAFGLAVAAGLGLAASYNTAFGVPWPQVNSQAVSILVFLLAIGMASTALVAGTAVRIPPLVTDPDAAV